ncbi:hypothetical protein [uncultured Aquimarina sp.]|uniref:hypothetical protein n=1 Tax=uncultured Aquimarina sp. TaxID=575652 RepID=UPI0026056233|nr:hypothetical protein [uncultured Aquimarina sp.]
MKELKIISVFIILIIILSVINLNKTDTLLKSGSISFISMESKKNEGFVIRTNMDISPNSKIRFTDSEWNGNRFGFDENDITWINGDKIIPAGTIINFININYKASVSYGTIRGSMRLSKENDAIFAYIGGKRMPTIFLAAITNNELGYGTLINTGLINGKTAITFQKEK